MNATGAVVTLIAELGVAVLANWGWRDLRRNGARRAAYLFATAAFLLAALVPFLYWVDGGWQPWLGFAMFVPAEFELVFPKMFIRLTGGPTSFWQLAMISQRISLRWEQMVKAAEVTDGDRAWLVEQAGSLNRLRTSLTTELIDLYQAKIADLLGTLGDPEGFGERADARNHRIMELHEGLDDRRQAASLRRPHKGGVPPRA